MTRSARPQRVLLLTTPSSYRVEPFLEAAARLGISADTMLDTPTALVNGCGLAADFSSPLAHAVIDQYAQATPPAAILALDDSGSLLAAEASQRLGLPHNAPAAAIAARNKYVMRTMLASAGVAIPGFALHSIDQDIHALSQQQAYPVVVKPLELNGSRGVIRANSPPEFVQAVSRLAAILRSIYPDGSAPVFFNNALACDSARQFLVETFIPGFEVAVEGLLDNQRLQVLALFDKPDPLDGPFFEETIYVTPSRLSDAVQHEIATCTAASAAALGLVNGPIHAELRVNEQGAWLVEVAGRSIGGLCSRTLQFGTAASLEELILRQACGLPVEALGRSGSAGGVMMIPIPEAGILRGISGLEAARQVVGVESVEITAPLYYPVVPLPEGESYLGFIFARGQQPAEVEHALRTAHACLQFSIMPRVELL